MNFRLASTAFPHQKYSLVLRLMLQYYGNLTQGKNSLSKGEPTMATATLSVNSVFKILSDQKLGFKFGDPDRPSDTSLACILPILRETTHKRQYITMPETEEVLVSDSGTINKINLKNGSKENVFVRSGTIFEGKGTQSRALTRSTVPW
jgi:hypothetical protein